MKRIIVLLMILFSTLLSAENEIGREKVEFKDKEFEKRVRWVINKPEGDIYEEDLEKVDQIGINEKNEINLEMIPRFINLEAFGIRKVDINKIKNMENIKRLKAFYIYNLELEAKSLLTDLDNLEIIEGENCNIADRKIFTKMKKKHITDKIYPTSPPSEPVPNLFRENFGTVLNY